MTHFELRWHFTNTLAGQMDKKIKNQTPLNVKGTYPNFKTLGGKIKITLKL